MAARHCDVDHTDDWTSSKDSRRCNLACLCRKHHLFKHLTGSDLIQIRPGILGWTTPLGQRYVTRPDPYPDELFSSDLDDALPVGGSAQRALDGSVRYGR
jgi:hypothetical protein